MRILLLICLLTFSSITLFAQRIGINSDGSSPDASAMLDVNSTDKGLLIPRLDIDDLTTAAPVTAPATGLMAFNTNIITGIGLYYWDGTAWVRFLSENDDVGDDNNWKLEGNEDTDPTVNFLGTIDNVDLVIRTNNLERIRVSAGGNVGIGQTNPTSKLHLHDGSFLISNPTGLQTSIYSPDGGVELYRDPTSLISSNVNGYIDFKDNPLHDYDVRIFYSNTLGTNGAFVLEGTTDGQPGTAVPRLTVLNENGNVGIGSVAPTQKLDIDGQIRIRGGNPVVGRVLTAIDADGNAEWQDAPAGGGGGGTLGPVGSQPYQNGRQVFTASGTGSDPGTHDNTSWVVPAGITAIRVQLAGGGGGSHDWGTDNSSGGCGGFVIGEIPVTPGETLEMYVGRGGRGYSNANNPRGGTGSYIARGAIILAGAGGGGGGRRDDWFSNRSSGGGISFSPNPATANSLNGVNGSTTTGGNGGSNYVGYLWNSIAYIGKYTTASAINIPGVSARYFTELFNANNANNYGFGARFGGSGNPGVIIVEW